MFALTYENYTPMWWVVSGFFLFMIGRFLWSLWRRRKK